jgi:hypothetical protein
MTVLRFRIALVLFCWFTLFLGGATSHASPDTGGQENDFILFHSGNILGEIEPCG